MAKSEQINVIVITPEQQIVEESADAVVFTAHDGELGVLRDRAALMCELGIGQLRYARGDRASRYFIDGGFAQVFDNQITVLTSRAMPAADVTDEVVDQAQQAIGEHTGHDEDSRLARERAQRRHTALVRIKSGN